MHEFGMFSKDHEIKSEMENLKNSTVPKTGYFQRFKKKKIRMDRLLAYETTKKWKILDISNAKLVALREFLIQLNKITIKITRISSAVSKIAIPKLNSKLKLPFLFRISVSNIDCKNEILI